MSTSTVYTLATWKGLAIEIWQEHKGALALISNQFLALAIAKPKGTTAKELYGALPQGWRDRMTEGSFGAQLSLAGRVHRDFSVAKKAGSFPKDADSAAFVSRLGSLEKAKRVLSPATSEGKAPADPKVGGEAKPSKGASVTEGKSVDKFGEVCRMVDELNESDLKALAMLVADKIAKMQAKASVKV